MKYWRVMLKRGDDNKAVECVRAGYIGVDTVIFEDVSNLPTERAVFIRHLLPDYMQNRRPQRTEKGAIQVLGSLWRIAKVMEPGDIVLSPKGDKFYAGKITGGYCYDRERAFFHCRPVNWSGKQIPRTDMPGTLPKGAGRVAVVNVSRYAEDLKRLLGDTLDE